MKHFLKRFIKLSWHGIPIGIIASVLVGGAVVVASTIIWSNVVTVHVVEKPPPPPVYELTLAAPDTVYVGDEIGFTGSLVDTANSEPIEGATVDILDMSSATVVATATTLANGTFTSGWTPTNPLIKQFQFKAKYLAP